MTNTQKRVLLVFAILIGLTRFAALSRGPWDWDEVQFCLAVGDFDVGRHAPHPPGFPLFIAMGQWLRPIAGSDYRALQTVAVLGALAIFPLFFALARALRFGFGPSLGAATVFAFLPNVWYYGGTAFGDVPSLALYLAALAAFFAVERNPQLYLAGSICLAAALLIRPHSFLIAVFPWTIATVHLLRDRRRRTAAIGVIALVAITAAGYIGAAIATGDAYFGALRGHGAYLVKADSVASAVRASLPSIARMQLDPYDAGKVSILLNALAVAGIVLGRRRIAAAILLTFAPYFFFIMVTANESAMSRMSLCWLGGIVLLATEGVVALTAFVPRLGPLARLGVFTVIVARLVWWALPALATVRATLPPPLEAVLAARESVREGETVLVHGSLTPWARYYLPRHRAVVFDGVPAAPEGHVIADGDTQNMHARHFVRPPHRIWNIVPHRYFEASLEDASTIARFRDGWYDLEGSPGDRWRWSGPRSTMELPSFPGRGELRLRFEVPVDRLSRPTTVVLRFNGVDVAKLQPVHRRNDVRVVVASRTGAPNVLEILVADSFRAPGDPRELALNLLQYGWRPL